MRPGAPTSFVRCFACWLRAPWRGGAEDARCGAGSATHWKARNLPLAFGYGILDERLLDVVALRWVQVTHGRPIGSADAEGWSGRVGLEPPFPDWWSGVSPGVTSAAFFGYGRARLSSSRRNFFPSGKTYLCFGAIGTRSACGSTFAFSQGMRLPLAAVAVVKGSRVLDAPRTRM